jgi:hypothetical protein
VSTGYEGALVARVTQSGSRISGTLQATGSPCLTFASISGTVTDREIQFDAVLGVDQMSFTATADMLELDAFGGPYSVTAGTCTGDQGMFELSR